MVWLMTGDVYTSISPLCLLSKTSSWHVEIGAWFVRDGPMSDRTADNSSISQLGVVKSTLVWRSHNIHATNKRLGRCIPHTHPGHSCSVEKLGRMYYILVVENQGSRWAYRNIVTAAHASCRIAMRIATRKSLALHGHSTWYWSVRDLKTC